MEISNSITRFAKQAKSLPLDKIVKSKDFKAVHLSENAIISKDDESIIPSNIGTVVDYLARYVLLADEHAFDLANIELKHYMGRNSISTDEIIEMMDKEKRVHELTRNISSVDEIPDEVFSLVLDICSWEMAFRSGHYVNPKSYPDDVTIAHIKLMLKRIEKFFDKFGWPTRDAYIAQTKNQCLTGDGDYLLKNTLVDLKVSNKDTMQPFWIRQLLLYYTLGFYNHFNDEKIDRLMIFNARTDTAFYIDIADINKSVFEFVNAAAEKQSLINAQAMKQLMGFNLN